MDINNFKYINDTYGHETGDRVISCFGEILSEVFYKEKEEEKTPYLVQIREEMRSKICRLGGDEFTIEVETSDEEELKRIIQDLHSRLLSFKKEDIQFKGLSASAGVINLDCILAFNIQGKRRDDPIDVADLVMYFAKGLAKRKFIERSENERVRQGLIIVRQWDDFSIIQDYSKLRVEPKPPEKQEEIKKKMNYLLDTFYEEHKILFKFFESDRENNKFNP